MSARTNGWRMEDVVSAKEILATLNQEWELEPVEPNYFGEVAERYRYTDGAGEVGIIASVTLPFCGACTRARLSADGELYTCLFGVKGHDLRTLLRDGATDEELAAAVARDLGHPDRPLLRDPQRRHDRPAQGRDVEDRRVAPLVILSRRAKNLFLDHERTVLYGPFFVTV